MLLKLLVVLFLEEQKALRNEIMELVSKQNNLSMESLVVIKSTLHTIEAEDGKHPIHHQLCRAGQRSRKGLCDHKNLQLKIGILEPAQ